MLRPPPLPRGHLVPQLAGKVVRNYSLSNIRAVAAVRRCDDAVAEHFDGVAAKPTGDQEIKQRVRRCRNIASGDGSNTK